MRLTAWASGTTSGRRGPRRARDALILWGVRGVAGRAAVIAKYWGMDSDQPSFTDVEYGNRRRVSRREQFLETMNATIP